MGLEDTNREAGTGKRFTPSWRTDLQGHATNFFTREQSHTSFPFDGLNLSVVGGRVLWEMSRHLN